MTDKHLVLLLLLLTPNFLAETVHHEDLGIRAAVVEVAWRVSQNMYSHRPNTKASLWAAHPPYFSQPAAAYSGR